MPLWTISYHLASLQGAETAINVEETRGYHQVSPHHHPWITGLKLIGVQYWQPHWCSHCQTGQKAPSVPGKVDNGGRPEPSWKLIYPSLKMRTQRMLWSTRVGGGIWWYTIMQDAENLHSSCMPFVLCKVTPENWYRAQGMDITLDDMLTILGEHYNNVKALDTLNQELFQLWMADKETILDWGIHLLRHFQVLAASFPDCFPPDCVAELKQDCFYGGLPKRLKAMVAYLKASPHEKTYSNYLWAVREAEKEESMEVSQNPWSQAIDNTTKPKLLVSSPCRSLKGTNQYLKWPLCTWCTWKRKALRGRWKRKSRTLMVSMALQKSSWCTLCGLWRMPKWRRNAGITA